MGFKSESQPLFKTYTAKKAGWIIDKAVFVQNSDQPVVQVGAPTVWIDKGASFFVVQCDRHGIHGEIAASQVDVNGCGRYAGQRSRAVKG